MAPASQSSTAHRIWDEAAIESISTDSSGLTAQQHGREGQPPVADMQPTVADMHVIYTATSWTSPSSTDSSHGARAKKRETVVDREREREPRAKTTRAEATSAAAASVSDREAHDMGRCRPCNFLLKRQGCINQSACAFCHFHHVPEDKRPQRPSKARRNQVKRVLNVLNEVAATHPESYDVIAEKLAQQCHYFRMVEHKGSSPAGSSSAAVAGSSTVAGGSTAVRGSARHGEAKKQVGPCENTRRGRAGALEHMLHDILDEEGIQGYKTKLSL